MAEWKTIKDPDGEVHFQCSACGMQWFLAFGTPAQNEMFYCPRCGKKMKMAEEKE